MEFPFFKQVEETRNKKNNKNKEFNNKKKEFNAKYGFEPTKQKIETEEYKTDKALLDRLAAEKIALEGYQDQLASQENEQLKLIERKPHETLEFYNRISMF